MTNAIPPPVPTRTTTSRIDEIRERLAQVNWRQRMQHDRDIEYLLVIIAEAEDRFERIRTRECEGSNHPGQYVCGPNSPCLGCALRQAEIDRDRNAQGWSDANELLQQVTRACPRCEQADCPQGCQCPCHHDRHPAQPPQAAQSRASTPPTSRYR